MNEQVENSPQLPTTPVEVIPADSETVSARRIPRPDDAQPRLGLVSIHSGPLPPAEWLERVEQICPGATREIIQDFRERGRDRRALSDKLITGDLARAAKAPWFTLTAFLFTVAVAVLFGLTNHEDLAKCAMLLAGGSAVTIYITSTVVKQQQQKALQKSDERVPTEKKNDE